MSRINVEILGDKVTVDGKKYSLSSLTGVKSDLIKYNKNLYRKVNFGNPDIYSQMPNVGDIVHISDFNRSGYYEVVRTFDGSGLVAVLDDNGESAMYSCSNTVSTTYRKVV